MAVKITNPTLKKLLKNEVVRFLFSNGVGFILDAIIYFSSYYYYFKYHNTHVFGFTFSGDVTALFVSYIAQIGCNFLLTKYFVFSESKLSAGKQFFRFSLVALIGFFANLELLKLFVKLFKMYPPVARMAAALSLGIASYFIHKFFSFNLRKRKS